ncbi:MAG TPA: cadherin-like beta sandwich domain-containing protein [Candidatus Kapabacteria bacterium]|nr:cadherin-like beta sandwich domain-containing protein [Candidatus Kapabacteria bacterium]
MKKRLGGVLYGALSLILAVTPILTGSAVAAPGDQVDIVMSATLSADNVVVANLQNQGTESARNVEVSIFYFDENWNQLSATVMPPIPMLTAGETRTVVNQTIDPPFNTKVVQVWSQVVGVDETDPEELDTENNKVDLILTAPVLTSLTENLSGDLTPSFSSDVTSYTMTAATNEERIQITANYSRGSAMLLHMENMSDWGLTSGVAQEVPLRVGQNTLNIVTSEDGVNKTYTVVITRRDPNASSLVINELFVNPLDNGIAEDQFDFIEFKNISDEPVLLAGWSIEDENGRKVLTNENDSSLGANSYTQFSPIYLNTFLPNNGGTVKLYNPNGTLVQTVTYGVSVDGDTYARQDDGTFAWSSVPTPSRANVFTTVDLPDVAVVRADVRQDGIHLLLRADNAGIENQFISVLPRFVDENGQIVGLTAGVSASRMSFVAGEVKDVFISNDQLNNWLNEVTETTAALRLMVDTDNHVDESNNTNNIVDVPYPFQVSELGDLTIPSLQLSDVGVLVAEVKNEGTQSISGNVQLQGLWTNTFGDPLLDGNTYAASFTMTSWIDLEAGATTSVTIDDSDYFFNSRPADARGFRLMVNSNGSIAENSLLNNAGTVQPLPVVVTLKEVQVGGTSHTFDAGVFTRELTAVANGVTSLVVKPVSNDPQATVTVNGVAVNEDTGEATVALAEGTNTITLVVTSRDGLVTQTYTLTVTRNADVSGGSSGGSSGGGSSSGGGGGGGISPSTVSITPGLNNPLIVTAGQEGTLQYTFDGGRSLILKVVRGGVTSQTMFTAAPATVSGAQNPGTIFNNAVFDINAVNTLNQPVTTFPADLTVILTIPGLDSTANVNVYYLNEATNAWVLVPGATFTNGVVQFTTNHLTKFALLRTTAQNTNTGTGTVTAPAPVQQVLGTRISALDELISGTKYGTRSAKVLELQKELQARGYIAKSFKVTNYYGPVTQAAVKKYQAEQKKAGQAAVLGTKVMDISSLMNSTKRGTRSEAVRQLQVELKKLGYFPQHVDTTGFYGAITADAVAKYRNQ